MAAGMRKTYLSILSLLLLWLLVEILRQPSESGIRFNEKQNEIANSQNRH